MPSAVAQLTVTGCELGFESVSVKVKVVLPTTAAGAVTFAREMAGCGSSPVIVPLAVPPAPIAVPALLPDRTTEKASSGSNVPSPFTVTENGCDVTPAEKDKFWVLDT